MVAVSESLHQALKHHEAGELDQAEALYRQIVRIDPGHIDALHLLGVAALQKADHRAGVEYISQAIAQGGNSSLYHSNLGACYRAMNRLDEAIASFREAVRWNRPSSVRGTTWPWLSKRPARSMKQLPSTIKSCSSTPAFFRR